MDEVKLINAAAEYLPPWLMGGIVVAIVGVVVVNKLADAATKVSGISAGRHKQLVESLEFSLKQQEYAENLIKELRESEEASRLEAEEYKRKLLEIEEHVHKGRQHLTDLLRDHPGLEDHPLVSKLSAVLSRINPFDKE